MWALHGLIQSSYEDRLPLLLFPVSTWRRDKELPRYSFAPPLAIQYFQNGKELQSMPPHLVGTSSFSDFDP